MMWLRSESEAGGCIMSFFPYVTSPFSLRSLDGRKPFVTIKLLQLQSGFDRTSIVQLDMTWPATATMSNGDENKWHTV